MTLPDQTPQPIKQYAWQSQADALLRHGMTAGATAITILGGIALIPADQATAAVQALQNIGDDLHKLFGDAAVLWGILGPVIMAFVAKWTLAASSLKGQLTSISRNPTVDIDGKIKVPPPVAAEVPSDKVVPK